MNDLHEYKEIKPTSLIMNVKASSDPDEEYTIDMIGSSEAKDRDGDIIKADGWDLANYKANPVFLWGHDHGGLPIGKAIKVKVNKKEKRLEFKIKFAVDEYPFAATVYRLFKSGFLNATSVGFMVKDWEYDEDLKAYVLLKNELLELSAVTVPANPEALTLGISKGLFNDSDVEHMKNMGMLKRIEKEVDELTEAEKLAKEVEDKKIEDARLAKEAADKIIEDERIAKEQADADEAARLAKEQADAEAEEKALEDAKLAKEVADAKALEDAKALDILEAFTKTLALVEKLTIQVKELETKLDTYVSKGIQVIAPPVKDEEPHLKTKEEIDAEIALGLGLEVK